MPDSPTASTNASEAVLHTCFSQLQTEGALPELCAALVPYLDRHDGALWRAIRELMTDLRFAAADEGVDFDAIADTVLADPAPRVRPAHPPEEDGHG